MLILNKCERCMFSILIVLFCEKKVSCVHTLWLSHKLSGSHSKSQGQGIEKSCVLCTFYQNNFRCFICCIQYIIHRSQFLKVIFYGLFDHFCPFQLHIELMQSKFLCFIWLQPVMWHTVLPCSIQRDRQKTLYISHFCKMIFIKWNMKLSWQEPQLVIPLFTRRSSNLGRWLLYGNSKYTILNKSCWFVNEKQRITTQYIWSGCNEKCMCFFSIEIAKTNYLVQE